MEALKEEIRKMSCEKNGSHEKIYDRLNSLEKAQAVHDFQYQTIMDSIKKQELQMEQLEAKLNQLIEKPSKRWDGIVTSAISAIIGGVVAYILVQLGIKG